MSFIVCLALLGLTSAAPLHATYENRHCYRGHGGTPLEEKDKPIKNITWNRCLRLCNNFESCVGITAPGSMYPPPGSMYPPYPATDCYLLSDMNISGCESVENWLSIELVALPPLTRVKVYHLLEAKYTGLANKDGGDFKGDAGFIFSTFSEFTKTIKNPEASMEHNILEMSEVNVTGWGQYSACNAPGAHGLVPNCPAGNTDYCCSDLHNRTSLPGITVSSASLGDEFGFPGWWYSFPKESQNVTWTEKVLRRIGGKCLGNAWRKEAGGCPKCGETLDECVADCIQASLCINGSVALLQNIWDRVFDDPKECPNLLFPKPSPLPTPAPTPRPEPPSVLPPWAWLIITGIVVVIPIIAVASYCKRNRCNGARAHEESSQAQLICP